MARSIQRLFILTASIFTVYFLYLPIIQIVQADVGTELRKKGEQCRSWVETGDLMRHQASRCLAACERYGHAVQKHPDMLSDAAVQGCKEIYLSTKNKVLGAKSKRSSSETTKPTLSSMPDVEGIYMQAMQGKLRVQVEGRDDWDTICNGFIRIKDRKGGHARKLKGRDRVRLIGITYNPDEPSGRPRGICSAERIEILGQSQ